MGNMLQTYFSILMNNLMLKMPSEIILKPIYHIKRRLAVVKFPSKLRQ